MLPLSATELRTIVAAWGGAPLFADAEGGCEGWTYVLAEPPSDGDLLATVFYVPGEPGDCEGAPTYTFNAAVSTLCADHCRLAIRVLRAKAASAGEDFDAAALRAMRDPAFPSDDDLFDACDDLIVWDQ